MFGFKRDSEIFADIMSPLLQLEICIPDHNFRYHDDKTLTCVEGFETSPLACRVQTADDSLNSICFLCNLLAGWFKESS